MDKKEQRKTPYLDALKAYVKENVSPFDVPGHHMGNVDNDFKKYVGEMTYKCDVNSTRGLDNLNHPTGVLVEAQELMAKACGADEAFFLINGTSAGIMAMIMAACSAHQTIIMPRNAHKSAINALVLSGATPVFIQPEFDYNLEIANQPSVESYKKAIDENPDTRAIFVINPTYFGAVTDLKELVRYAHERNILVLVDEAHGTHFGFNQYGPYSAMECGADLSAISMHKTGGSLTQSSVLLRKGNLISHYEIAKTLTIINTTSPSTLLLASLDSARKYMATKGQVALNDIVSLTNYARKEIERIPGFKSRGREYFLSQDVFDYDDTKLVIELEHINLNGFQLYNILKDEYHIQMELAEAYVVLAIVAIGSKKEHIDHLIDALKDISKRFLKTDNNYPKYRYNQPYPHGIVRPRTAYHAPLKVVDIDEAEGMISKESIMIYPPGIPLIIPGEIFSDEIVKRIKQYRSTGATILSDYEDKVSVIDVDNWDLYDKHKKDIEEYYGSLLAKKDLSSYNFPFEGKAHKGTIVELPFREDTWRENAIPALDTFFNLVSIISRYEKVYLIASKEIKEDTLERFKIKNVELIRMDYNDSWARDNSLIYLQKNGKNVAVDFGFNAWGGDFDGLYEDFDADNKLGLNLANYFSDEYVGIKDFILEGGSIHTDGEGTLLTTEACLLSKGRNYNLSKEEIEERLKRHLGIKKVLWLKNGIYNDETNEHVDNMACFLAPGVVALATCEDKNDIQYKYSSEAKEYLQNCVDAKGRKIKVIEIPVPLGLKMTREECSSLVKKDGIVREEGTRLAASYINFYQGEKFVIVPAFGVKEDEYAFKVLKEFYKDKDVYQLKSREILLGGGNIHCVTMQIPLEEK